MAKPKQEVARIGSDPRFDGPEIRLDDLTPNSQNPRIMRDPKFKKLTASITDFPRMMRLKPITVDSRDRPAILGGNMRYMALKAAGYTTIPRDWVQFSEDVGLTELEKRRFVIQDNVNAGEWDYDLLANDFSAEELDSWGLSMDFALPGDGEPGTPASGGHELSTQVGDVYTACIGDTPSDAIGYQISAPKWLNGTEPIDGANDAFKALFKEIDKSLQRFAKNCRKSGLTFIITKNGEDITTKF